MKLFKCSHEADTNRSVLKCKSRELKPCVQINSSWSLCVNVKITSKKLQQTETNPLEPNAVAKRHCCQNLAHWLDRMVLPGNRCLASSPPGSADKKLEVHTHTHTPLSVVADVLLVQTAASHSVHSLLLVSWTQISLQQSGHQTVNVPCCCRVFTGGNLSRRKTSSCWFRAGLWRVFV